MWCNSGVPYSFQKDRGTRNGNDGVLRGDLGVLMGDVVEEGEGWVVELVVGVGR